MGGHQNAHLRVKVPVARPAQVWHPLLGQAERAPVLGLGWDPQRELRSFQSRDLDLATERRDVDRRGDLDVEIVTGALHDRGRAKVVGTRTYGKGVFQEIEPLPNGGALDFTVGEYFTPNGTNLGGGGVLAGVLLLAGGFWLGRHW